MKVLIDSVYINNSGGKVLFNYLVEELEKTDLDLFYLIDQRCKGEYPSLNKDKVLFIKASIKDRHLFYLKFGAKFSRIFCFGNIPPTVRTRSKVYCYFHNVLLLQLPRNYPLKRKLLFLLKRYFLLCVKNNADNFIVQSQAVKQLLASRLSLRNQRCLVIPFYRPRQISRSTKREDGFVYVSNANPHKNHINLLTAWRLLRMQGCNHPLHLTVTDSYPDVIRLINIYKSEGVHIFNHGLVDATELYSRYKYAIYPSLAESFGLGLVEAVEAGMEVIAADLPYVKSIIDPLTTFDPDSPDSIVDSVISALSLGASSSQISRSKISNDIGKLVELMHCPYTPGSIKLRM